MSKLSILQLVIVAVLIVGLVSGLILIKRQQSLKSKAAAAPSTPMIIGFNVTGLPHYGYGDKYFDSQSNSWQLLFPTNSTSDIYQTLEEIQNLGGRVIRVWIANDTITDEEVASRLDKFLTRADNYGISVIVSLLNYYGTHNNPKNLDVNRYYENTGFFLKLLNNEFFREGYKTSFLNFIRTVVEKNKHHQNIYAWEMGNELQDRTNSDNLINFIKDVSCTIKRQDPQHAVSTGFLHSFHALNVGVENGYEEPKRLYNAIKDCIDIISVVSHKGHRSGQEYDLSWAKENNKNFIVAEAGFGYEGYEKEDGVRKNYDIDCSKNRAPCYSNEMTTWAGQGAKAYLIWGFARRGISSDNKNLDKNLGLDRINHAQDYDNVTSAVRNFTSTNQFQALTLMKFDLSNNADFLNDEKDNKTITGLNPNQEQSLLWLHERLYLRKYFTAPDLLNFIKNTYKIPIENREAIELGKVFVEVRL